jgi:2-methylcitrate dehydratase PrpD
MTGGGTFSAHCEEPLGAPKNKLSRAQIEAKFRTYAAERLSQPQIETVIGVVAQLEQAASVRPLMDVLRATPQSAASAPVAVAARA